MPCRSIFQMIYLCTEKIRWSTAAGYLHVEVELVISLLDGGVLTQAGRELWQLQRITLLGITSDFHSLRPASRPWEPSYQILRYRS